MVEIAEEFGLIGPDQRLLYGLVFEAKVLEQLGAGEGKSTEFKLTDQFSEWLREQKLTIEMGPAASAPNVSQTIESTEGLSPKLLISIVPEFIQEIFSGAKKIELRKRRPKFLQPGDRVLVYASTPSQALTGEITIKNIVEGTPQELWNQISAISGASKEMFDDYYKDHSTAVGLIIDKAIEYQNKISLAEIKRSNPDFSPPKNYRYMIEGDPLLSLAKKAAEKV
jgi:predicted transcriptional regulator